MVAFFCCLRCTEANDLLLITANFTWYSDWAFTDMPFGKHVSSIFIEAISSSNLSAATLNLASSFFFVLLEFSFILLFCCALPLWTVCPLNISFKRVNELFALSCKLSISFLIPATSSNCSWVKYISPAHPFPAWCGWNHTILCYFDESHLLHGLPIESSGQLIDMLHRPKEIITGMHFLFVCGIYLKKTTKAWWVVRTKILHSIFTVFLVCFFFPSALFSQQIHTSWNSVRYFINKQICEYWTVWFMY